jgi:Icc-related predicted phosphoesterase
VAEDLARLVLAEPKPEQLLRIVHISDTHNLHGFIENLPDADILIHTGDFTNHGTEAEFADFNAWLGDVRTRIPHVLVILGNHDWNDALRMVETKECEASQVLDPSFMRNRLSNCTLLLHEEVEIMGLRIFGSSWVPWHAPKKPEKVGGNPVHSLLWHAAAAPAAHRYAEIPKGTDVLLTHCPPHQILDCVGQGYSWGSSEKLFKAIVQARPRAHLFGHLHEQRGVWRRQPNGSFRGGVEYILRGVPFETVGPPPDGYPCDLICNTAMQNHPKLEGIKKKKLAGVPRLITAERREGQTWTFHTA